MTSIISGIEGSDKNDGLIACRLVTITLNVEEEEEPRLSVRNTVTECTPIYDKSVGEKVKVSPDNVINSSDVGANVIVTGIHFSGSL
jgi:hypothetical protein